MLRIFFIILLVLSVRTLADNNKPVLRICESIKNMWKTPLMHVFCQNSLYTAVYSNLYYSRIDLDVLKFLRNVSFLEVFKIFICVNGRSPESTSLWKAIWYLNFWYLKLYFICFSILSIKNWKMKRIQNLVLFYAVVATKDFRAMNPECPDIDGEYRFDRAWPL